MRDLQSLCDRLNEVFNADDDIPEELSQEAREAIEELWEARDNLSAKLAAIPASELGWLVERTDAVDGRQLYRTMDESGTGWTDDHNQAIRFARRADAEMFAAGDEDAWHIVEHMWPRLPDQHIPPRSEQP